MIGSGQKAVFVSSTAMALLAALKGTIGFLASSSILVADALHSFADLIAGAASWFGLRIARRKPDEMFPYGYYKVENLAALLITAFLAYAAIELMLEGYRRLLSLQEIGLPYEALAAAAISAVVSLWQTKYLGGVAEKTNLQSVYALSRERWIDFLSSLVVFAGVFSSIYAIPYVEGVLTMVISALILRFCVEMGRDSVFALLDVSPGKELEKRVSSIAQAIPGVRGVSNIKLRKSGPFVFGEVAIEVEKYVDVARAHEIADLVEKRVKEEVEVVDSLTVHVEPYRAEQRKVVIPVEKPEKLASPISEHFGRAPYFLIALVDVNSKKVLETEVVENPYRGKEVRAGLAAAKMLINKGVDTLITSEIGEISLHTLRDELVEVYQAEGETAEEVLNRYLDNLLTPLTKPTKEKEA